MRACYFGFAFCVMIACLPAQSFQAVPPNQPASQGQAIAPGLNAAILRSLMPSEADSQPRVQPHRFIAPRMEAMNSPCSVRLTEVPIRKDVEFTMRAHRVPKNVDRGIAARPPAPACPQDGDVTSHDRR